LVAAKVREKLAGSKRPVNKVDVERFILKKLNEWEVSSYDNKVGRSGKLRG
jgi:hypothetical protein